MHHPVVSQEKWLEARKALFLKEKEFTHLRERANTELLAAAHLSVYHFIDP